MRRLYIFLSWIIITIAASGCKNGEQEKKMTMVKQAVQTHCIGHHLMDFPLSYHFSVAATGTFKERSSSEKDKPIEIMHFAGDYTPESFAAALAKRKAEIIRRGSDNDDELRLTRPLNRDTTIFRIQRLDDAYRSEMHLLSGSSYLVASVNSFNNHFDAAEERLIRLAANVQEITTGDNSRHHGFCLGKVSIAGNYQEESVDITLRSNDYPGTSFSVNFNTYEKDESIPLLSRASGPNSLLSHMGADYKVLRKGEITVAGMRAQEWIGWFMLGKDGESKQHGFDMETMRPIPGVLAPRIHVSFDTGDALPDGTRVKTVMSDGDAVAL